MTRGTATAAAITPAAMIRQERPARTTTMAPVSSIRIAVPRSGCLATRATGARIRPAGISSHQDSWAFLPDRPW